MAWFDARARHRKYPNAYTLAKTFEISPRTAQRAIDFMRDRMAAPLEYDPVKKGYFYSDQSFSLPPLQADQEEILALILARNLLTQSEGGFISRSIRKLSRKLISESLVPDLSEARLDELFSASWTGYAPAPLETFKRCMNALMKHLCLSFDYAPPGIKTASTRTVEPHHLQHYMGSWVLIAWCRQRNDWRKFYLSRMGHVRMEKTEFIPRPYKDWKFQINSAFGIFQNPGVVTVTLRFSAYRAGWIKEQVWHPAQVMKTLIDGSLVLSLPVSDFREIKLKILQFGADVEVMEPPALREEIEAEIAKMAGIYKK
jgi:predicted DNA-binding transcriptional regulator YafY